MLNESQQKPKPRRQHSTHQKKRQDGTNDVIIEIETGKCTPSGLKCKQCWNMNMNTKYSLFPSTFLAEATIVTEGENLSTVASDQPLQLKNYPGWCSICVLHQHFSLAPLSATGFLFIRVS